MSYVSINFENVTFRYCWIRGNNATCVTLKCVLKTRSEALLWIMNCNHVDSTHLLLLLQRSTWHNTLPCFSCLPHSYLYEFNISFFFLFVFKNDLSIAVELQDVCYNPDSTKVGMLCKTIEQFNVLLNQLNHSSFHTIWERGKKRLGELWTRFWNTCLEQSTAGSLLTDDSIMTGYKRGVLQKLGHSQEGTGRHSPLSTWLLDYYTIIVFSIIGFRKGLKHRWRWQHDKDV